MRVLLDTNVILDLFLDRAPFADAAATLWLAHERTVLAGVRMSGSSPAVLRH